MNFLFFCFISSRIRIPSLGIDARDSGTWQAIIQARFVLPFFADWLTKTDEQTYTRLQCTLSGTLVINPSLESSLFKEISPHRAASRDVLWLHWQSERDYFIDLPFLCVFAVSKGLLKNEMSPILWRHVNRRSAKLITIFFIGTYQFSTRCVSHFIRQIVHPQRERRQLLGESAAKRNHPEGKLPNIRTYPIPA